MAFYHLFSRIRFTNPISIPFSHNIRWSAVLALSIYLGLGVIAAKAADDKLPPIAAIPGKFSVSSGAAIYSIPLIVPPGTAGMSPALSLDYSTQSGDSTVGLGWALTGLPSITRCARTLADDSVHGGVNFNSSDRFCLNGQRLVAVTGAYGADGTVYRTQIENFSKIISHGTAGTGPQWFEVHTLAGQTLQFGNTTDSRILAKGTTTARVWAVNKVIDTKGNYLTATYTNDTTNGQAYPIEVDYTGNTAAGLTPYNSIKFTYTTRPDIVPTYQAGSLIQTTVLLSEIKTYNGANVVTDYKLTYRLGSSTLRSRLTSIAQCDSTGTTCLPATTFGWQGGSGLPTYTKYTEPTTMVPRIGGDFNGDGLTDVLTGLGLSSSISFGTTTNGSFVSSSYTVPGGPPILPIPDIDADGYSDYIGTIQIFTQYYFSFYKNDRISNFANVYTLNGASLNGYQFGDMNGDGKADFTSVGANFRAYFGDGTGTFNAGSIIDPAVTSSTATLNAIGDFDGDGCSDILIQAANGSSNNKIYYQCAPAVSSYIVPNWQGMSATYSLLQLIPGDFNGDGKADMLASVSSGTSSPPCPFGKMYLSTGTSLVATSFSVPNDWCKYTILAGDFNGDGKADLALIPDGIIGHYGTGHNTQIYISTGTGFVLAATIPGPTRSAESTLVAADWNSDGVTDLWIDQPISASPYADNAIYIFQYTPELITTINNGIGSTTTISYDRINKNGAFYAKGGSATYPDQDFDTAIYVVSQVDQQSSGGTHTTTYAYAGARMNWTGRGFLGFAQVVATDQNTGVVETTNYDQIFPLLGMVDSQTTTAPKTGGGTVVLSSTTNSYDQVSLGTGTDGVARYFVEPHQVVVARNDEDFVTGIIYALPTVTTVYTYDCDTGGACGGASPTGFGNVLVANKSFSDGSSTTTTNTYDNDATNWILSRLRTSNVESIVGASDLTRHFAYTYQAGTGLVVSETLEPGASDPSLTRETDYTYDAYGNKIEVDVKGCVWTAPSTCTAKTRTTLYEYDVPTYHGAFLTKITRVISPSNHIDSFTYNAYFGVQTGHTDPNGLVTSWSYDTFGREILETRPDGNKTGTAYSYCTGLPSGESCPTGGQFDSVVTPQNSAGTQNGAISIKYVDSLLRVLADDTQGFSAGWIRAAQQYDSSGRVVQSSRPYFLSGGTPRWTVNTYDPLGRATTVIFPDASKTTTSFQGLTVVATNDLGQTLTTTKNAQDLVASTTDALTNMTSFVYDAFGNALTITDAATPTHHTITNTYDLRGRKKTTSDPDMGLWSYVYDSYDELYSQTDAKSQTATLTYDDLGRILTRTETSLTSTWVYDTAAHGVDKLASATTGSNYTRTHSYDTLSRPSSTVLTIDGTNYSYTTTYNADGHIDTVTYPSTFVAKYVYTVLGYLSQIKDSGGTGQVFWTVNSRDAELHLTGLTAGNNVINAWAYDPNTGLVQTIQAGPSATPTSVANFAYTFDTIGNLTKRIDGIGGYTEWFCYDALNQLKNYAIGSSCTASGNKSVNFDNIGNITSKSDVGGYTYSGVGAGPHAVTSISGTVNGVLNPVYTYDANGNEVCVYPSASGSCAAGAIRNVTWTSFNMISQIVQGGVTTALSYDPEHARYKQCVPVGCTTTQTIYLNDDSSGTKSEKYTAGSTVTWKDYFVVDGQIAGVRLNTGGTVTQNYYSLDSLGSVSVITDGTGAVVTNGRLSYDAWGKMRQSNGADDPTCSLPAASPSTRGFTNQEQIASACAVNLNARIYDPAIGKFLSADDVVAHPELGQSYNRYTYVDNRPLSATDVSGHYGYALVTVMPPYRNPEWDPTYHCSGDCGASDQMRATENALAHVASEALTQEGYPPSGVKVRITQSLSGYNVSISATFGVGEGATGKPNLGTVQAVLASVLNTMAGTTDTRNADVGSSKFGQVSFTISTRGSPSSSGGELGDGNIVHTVAQSTLGSSAGHGVRYQLAQGAAVEGDPPEEENYSEPVGRRGRPMDVRPGTNEDTELGGRWYSGHALDQMQGRGVTPSAVEDAIKNGNSGDTYQNRLMFVRPENGITVITEQNGTVVTVITTPRKP